MEPPDPEYYCRDCAHRNFAEALYRGGLIYCWWIKPDWHIQAHSVLTNRKKRSKSVSQCSGEES